MNKPEEQLFEAIGELHLAITRMEHKKKVFHNSVDKCDGLAVKVLDLEQKYLKKYKTLPKFCNIG